MSHHIHNCDQLRSSFVTDQPTQVDRYGLRKRSFAIVYGAVYDRIFSVYGRKRSYFYQIR